jgi:hypothetical protein
MRVCFTLVILFAMSATQVAFGGEVAADGTKSVLVNTDAPAVAARAPCDGNCAQAQIVCLNGRCARLYNAETESHESCRNRLFGGTVVRKGSRTVYKPVRR